MKKLIYIITMALFTTGVQAQIDRSVRPTPGPAPTVQIQQPDTFELPNGMTVMVVENHKLPRVTASLRMDNPPYVLEEKDGVDDLMGSLLGTGTSEISKDDFQEEVDFMGARVSFSPNGAFVSSLSKYFPRVLEMIALAIINPDFKQEDFDKDLARMLDALKMNEKDVETNASQVENVLVYGANHPKGEFVTAEKLNNLKLDDVKAFHENYYIPNNAYLTIVGDVKFDVVKAQVQKYFSNWKKGSLSKSNYKDPKNVAKTEIDFVDMPNAAQSVVAFAGSSNLKMTDKDYYPAMLANRVLGGDFNSYLNMALREDNGWTYGARSGITADKEIGKFRGGASVRNEVTDSAVVVMMEQLKRARTTKPTDEMLNTVKASLIGNFVMNAEKPETIAGFAYQTATQNLPKDFYTNYIKNINAVTPEQVQAATQKYFLYDNTRIIVVGKAADVLEGLEKLPYKINYYDRFGNPTSKPEQKKVSASVTPKSVLNKYIDAIGGEKVKSIKNMTAVYEAEMQGMKMTITNIATNDGKTSEVVSAMGMEVQKNVFNGETGYVSSQGQKMDYTEEQIADAKEDGAIFPELKMVEKDLAIKGIENFGGKDAYVLVDGESTSYYDVDSGLKLGESEEVEGPGGQKMNQTVYYSDYQEHNGIKVPGKLTMDVGMEIVAELKDVKFDQDIDNSIFE